MTLHQQESRPHLGKTGAEKFGAEPSAPSPIITQRLLRSKEAATYLGVGTRTLWTMANLGEIASVRFSTGGRASVRFDVRDLDAFIERQRTGGQA